MAEAGLDDYDWRDHVALGETPAGRKAILRGTTLVVESLLRELADGATIHELRTRHPELTPERLRAVFALAAASVHRKHPPVTPEHSWDDPEWLAGER